MNLGFIKMYRNDEALAKLHWIIFKLFKIKRTTPCGRCKDEHYLCCMLDDTEKTCYLVYDEYGYEVRCKCCDAVKISGNGHPKTIQQAISWDWEEEYV